MFSKLKIYYLIDDRDGAICYVGKTRGSLKTRLQLHKNQPHNRNKWQWIRRYPVSIHLAKEGTDYDELNEIVKVLSSGRMLFNHAPLPKMTPKERKIYQTLKTKWAEHRLQESISDDLKCEVSSFMDALKYRLG